jgi:Tfp pilus assembly protein PilX
MTLKQHTQYGETNHSFVKDRAVMKRTAILENENGAVLLVAMMILTLIAIVATTYTRNTTVELQIVRNDTGRRQQFYLAESAAREAAQQIENLPAETLSDISTIDWINRTDLNLNALDLYDVNNLWVKSAVDNSPGGTVEVGYSVVEESGPIDLSAASNMHVYSVVGLYDVPDGLNKGQVLIEVGYRRRF